MSWENLAKERRLDSQREEGLLNPCHRWSWEKFQSVAKVLVEPSAEAGRFFSTLGARNSALTEQRGNSANSRSDLEDGRDEFRIGGELLVSSLT